MGGHPVVEESHDPNLPVRQPHGRSGKHGAVTSVTARAPGRVNLIGDHTDYNGGLCLPFAISLAKMG